MLIEIKVKFLPKKLIDEMTRCCFYLSCCCCQGMTQVYLNNKHICCLNRRSEENKKYSFTSIFFDIIKTFKIKK
jgi:hypothetical protein